MAFSFILQTHLTLLPFFLPFSLLHSTDQKLAKFGNGKRGCWWSGKYIVKVASMPQNYPVHTYSVKLKIYYAMWGIQGFFCQKKKKPTHTSFTYHLSMQVLQKLCTQAKTTSAFWSIHIQHSSFPGFSAATSSTLGKEKFMVKKNSKII